jgi:hypothetical protein
MSSRFTIGIALAATLASAMVRADAQKHEWFGTWSMNHDGHVGTLLIEDIKADCIAPAWCDMIVVYDESSGARRRVRIESFDDRFQHMHFRIVFPGNEQAFDAYVFSWDKAKMAGTTQWGGRTFGFFATKR